MENQTSSIEALWDRVRSYIETRAELLKLKAIDKSSSVISGIVSMLIVILICFIILGLVNIGLAFLLGELLGKVYYGFFVLAGVYIIIGIVLFKSKDKILKTPIINAMVKSMME